ncbi:MAG: thiamine phosphate synthase [Thermodesulfobacteriota bacterium]
MKATLSGLYIITDKKLIERDNFLNTVEFALKGGANIVQLREKDTSAEEILLLGKRLLSITKKYYVPLIINDYPEVAHEIGADGVHLGENDPDVKTARKIIGNDKIIGVSCYNRIDRGEKAVRDGADYIVFGTPYYTPTKPDREPTSLDTLLEAIDRFRDIPIFAIGGINENNAGTIIEAGVDGIAVITGIFGSEDPEKSARTLSSLFTRP